MVFRFALGRSGEVARGFLGDYQGILQTEGYAGYNHVGEVGMVHAGCWSHARRYFIDALKVHPGDGLAALLSKTTRERATRVANIGLKPLELSLES